MTAASSQLSKLKIRLQQQVHGLSSEQVAFVQDPSSKVNGGQMAACIQNDYERDYIIEALMHDRLH